MREPDYERYPKAPVLEGTLSVHFSEPPDEKIQNAFVVRRKANFPKVEDLLTISGTVDIQTKNAEAKTQKVGYKLTDADAGRVVNLNRTQLACSILTPYSNWFDLRSWLELNWKELKKTKFRNTINRVSTRFINRIDIPIDPQSNQVNLDEYLNVGVTLPTSTQSMTIANLSVNCTLASANDGLHRNIRLQSVQSPLIDHISFVIDLDLYTSTSPFRSESAMWAAIDGLRAPKNDLFEACITEKARALFR
jgi:uncharacterized protein (TIGR04255 family)